MDYFQLAKELSAPVLCLKSLEGAHDRGSSDAYYGRKPDPHYYQGHTNGYSPGAVKVTDLTEAEKKAYMIGYNGEDDRKDWGGNSPQVADSSDFEQHSTWGR